MRWSNSSLYTLQQCGERFRRKYIERDFRPSGIRAKRGIAVHKVAGESHMRQLRRKGDAGPTASREIINEALPSVEEARSIAADSFRRAVEEGVAWSDDEKKVGIQEITGETLDETVAVAGMYVTKRAPEVNPVAVERRIIIKPSDMDVEIVGIIDLADEEELTFGDPFKDDQPPETRKVETVWDLKTSNKTPNRNAAAFNQQLTLYSLIRTADKGGKPPDFVGLATMVVLKGGMKKDIQRARRSREDLSAVAERLSVGIESVKRGVFVPANPDAWWCSARYYEYHADCPFALGRISVAIGGAE